MRHHFNKHVAKKILSNMENNIFYLEVDMFDDESGVQCISFVDHPAIGVSYQAFEDTPDSIYKDYLKTLIPLIEKSGRNQDEVIKEESEKDDNVEPIAYYKYERNKGVKSKGGESRDFCSSMSNFKLYTKEEIYKLRNPGFGPKSSPNVYDIYKYRGGLNCQHIWVEYKIIDKKLVKSNPQPTDQPTPVPAATAEGKKRMAKFSSDTTRNIIMSPVMLAETLMPRVFNEYVYYVKFSSLTIENMMKKVMIENKQHNINMSHNSLEVIDGVFMVESFIYDDRMSLANFEGIPKGSWIASYYVPDTEQFNELLANPNFNGFSLEGNFSHVSQKDLVQTILNDTDLTEDNKVKQIKNILNI